MLKIDSYKKNFSEENSIYFMEFNVNFKRFMKFILHAFTRSETSINYKKNYATVGYLHLIGERPKIARYITEL